MSDAKPGVSPARISFGWRANWRRRVRQFLQPDNLKEFGTTMALVAPLTVLIWVWAEREQISIEPTKLPLAIDVQSADPGHTMSVVNDLSQRETVLLDLTGPRSGLDEVKLALKDRQLTVDVTDHYEIGGPYDIRLQPLLDGQDVFRRYGVSVQGVTPETVRVSVDRLVEKDLPLRIPADLATRVQLISTDLDKVKVRGPEKVIKALEADGKLRADLDLSGDPELLSALPGTRLSPRKVAVRSLNIAGVSLDTSQMPTVTLQISQEREGVIPSMVINISQPAALNAPIRIDAPTLTNVKIIGPTSDVIDRLVRDESDSRPYAELVFKREDKGTSGSRMPVFRNLPPGVRVKEGTVCADRLRGGRGVRRNGWIALRRSGCNWRHFTRGDNLAGL